MKYPLGQSLYPLAILWLITSSAEGKRFQQFYPGVDGQLRGILQTDCSYRYNTYIHNESLLEEPGCKACPIATVTSCILDNLAEVDKANMAGATVLLGLLPGTLSLAGSSTAETGTLMLRRPLLGFLLGAGSPAVSPVRTYEYQDPIKSRAGRWRTSMRPLDRSMRRSLLISVCEYIVAIAAVANVAIVSYQLSVRTICGFAEETIFQPALWAFLALLIHILGAVATTLRVRLEPFSKTSHSPWYVSWAKREFQPTASQDRISMSVRPNTTAFVVLSWFVSTGTVIHIIYGTLVFSSMLLISTVDAVTVAVQFLVSVVACRIILMYELGGLWVDDLGSESSGLASEDK